MARVNSKTVRLSAGKHDSPEQGACVVELASMLAEEPFTDKPGAVSPVIRDFLRDYNDDLDYTRRQELHGIAANLVGTKGSRRFERARAEICIQWVDELCESTHVGLPRWWVRLCVLVGHHAVAGQYAGRTAGCLARKETHGAALELVERLMSVQGRAEDAEPRTDDGRDREPDTSDPTRGEDADWRPEPAGRG